MEQFSRQHVRTFVTELLWPKYPSSSSVAPSEYVAVVEAGKSAVPFLLLQLDSRDVVLNAAATIAIEDITNKVFADYTRDFDQNRDEDRWRQVAAKYQAWWSEHKSQPQVAWIVDDLSAPEPNRRISATQKLGALGDSSSIPDLRKMLNDQATRLYAAEALAQLGDHEAIPVLINEFLSDDALSNRMTGICLLRQLTGLSMEFRPNADQASRTAAIERWRKWFATSDGKGHSR